MEVWKKSQEPNKIYATEFWQHKLLTLGPSHSSFPIGFRNSRNKALPSKQEIGGFLSDIVMNTRENI